MQRILLISGGSLPVPAVKGGAVETLMESLIEQNEKHPVFFLEVASGGNSANADLAENYRYTKFHLITYPLWPRMIDAVKYWYMENVRHNWRSMFVRNQEKSRYYARKLTERLPLKDYDAIIVENNMSLLEPLAGKLGDRFSETCYYHMHSDLVDNPAMIPYLAKCRKILVVSDYVKQELYKKVPEFADTCIEKVTNGIKVQSKSDTARGAERSSLRKRYGISDKEKVFLYCGRLSPEKGILELVKAFREVKAKQTRLVVAGSAFSGENSVNGYVKQIQKLASECGDRILFTGYVPHEKTSSYYYMADALVVPSVVGDAAPLTVMEGMACGTYLIASGMGGIPEYAKQYQAKTLVECDENFVSNLKNAMERFCEMDLDQYIQMEKTIFSDTDFFYEFGRAIMGT